VKECLFFGALPSHWRLMYTGRERGLRDSRSGFEVEDEVAPLSVWEVYNVFYVLMERPPYAVLGSGAWSFKGESLRRVFLFTILLENRFFASVGDPPTVVLKVQEVIPPIQRGSGGLEGDGSFALNLSYEAAI